MPSARTLGLGWVETELTTLEATTWRNLNVEGVVDTFVLDLNSNNPKWQ